MAMALGLGFSSPPTVLGHGSVLVDRSGSVPAHRRSRRFIVRAINEDEARITSMRELADGSLLISFGGPATAASSSRAQDAPKAHTLPPRPPSRYSKEFSYIPKRTKKYTGTELSLVVPSSVEKKMPARVPSTFSKKSPISRGVSGMHRRKSSAVESVESGPVLAFKDIQIEEEEVTQASMSKLSRPKTTFARKSPIPDETKSTTAGGKGKSKLPAVQQVLDTVTKEKHGEPRISRPETTFIRKSPITFGKVRRKARSSRLGASEQSSSAVVSLEDNLATIKSNNGTARPTSVFTRKSPITPGKGGKKRRPSSSENSSSESAVKSEKVSDDSSANEEHNSTQLRSHATFVRKSPITHTRSGRRKRRAAKKFEQEPKAPDVAVEAIPKPSKEFVFQTEDASAVTEVIVETPTDAIKITLGEKESVLVEAVGVADGEPAGLLLETEDKVEKISSELDKDGHDLGILHGNMKRVEAADTDIEFSDDDAAASDETDLSILTIQRLRSIAKSRGLRGYSRLRKAELIELLRKS